MCTYYRSKTSGPPSLVDKLRYVSLLPNRIIQLHEYVTCCLGSNNSRVTVMPHRLPDCLDAKQSLVHPVSDITACCPQHSCSLPRSTFSRSTEMLIIIIMDQHCVINSLTTSLVSRTKAACRNVIKNSSIKLATLLHPFCVCNTNTDCSHLFRCDE